MASHSHRSVLNMSDKAQAILGWILGVEGATTDGFTSDDLELSREVGLAAFSLALEKSLGEETSADAVQSFLARARGTWIKPEALNPVLAEQVILAAYQDDHLLEGIPRATLERTQNLLTYAFVRDAGLSDNGFQEFRREVIELMNTPLDDDE